MNKILKIVPYLVIAILVGVTVSYAGSLTPPGTPAQSMYKLSDLYELINTGANTPDTSFTTPGTISATMNSLQDIYELMTTKIAAIDGATILTGTTIFGVEGSATPAPADPIFATGDETTYQCENLALDPIQPAVTLQTICGYHTGCSWSGSACTGGTQTPTDGYFTWYAAKAACANSTREGQTAGTWRLPTATELFKHYLDNNIAGVPPINFISDSYWSSTAHPLDSYGAYVVGMGNGGANDNNKSNPGGLVHCTR